MAANTPDSIVWIDDQLQYEEEAQEWAGFLGARVLMVSPDPRHGITPSELAAVSTFLAQPLF